MTENKAKKGVSFTDTISTNSIVAAILARGSDDAGLKTCSVKKIKEYLSEQDSNIDSSSINARLKEALIKGVEDKVIQRPANQSELRPDLRGSFQVVGEGDKTKKDNPIKPQSTKEIVKKLQKQDSQEKNNNKASNTNKRRVKSNVKDMESSDEGNESEEQITEMNEDEPEEEEEDDDDDGDGDEEEGGEEEGEIEDEGSDKEESDEEEEEEEDDEEEESSPTEDYFPASKSTKSRQVTAVKKNKNEIESTAQVLAGLDIQEENKASETNSTFVLEKQSSVDSESSVSSKTYKGKSQRGRKAQQN